MEAVVASIRPMKESTISSAEMSMSTPRLGFHDPVSQVVLQAEGEPVVHVHLNGGEQKLAHLQNGNPIHGCLLALVRRPYRLLTRAARKARFGAASVRERLGRTPDYPLASVTVRRFLCNAAANVLDKTGLTEG